jgi:predicted esterase
MFVEAYGAGRLRVLAQSERFVVISPQTNLFAAGGVQGMLSALHGMLAEAEARYPVDRSSVLVVGHSMGAGVAWQLAMASQNQDERSAGIEPIRAVACLAGPCGPLGLAVGDRDVAFPRLLLISGELDPLASPARMEQAAIAATTRGVHLTYRELPNQGHTLMVGAILDEVIEWLLDSLDSTESSWLRRR